MRTDDDAHQSTRIVIKNVPRNIKEEALRKFLGEGITELSRLHSRGMAFCGFRSAALASRCVTTLNGAYLQTSKVIVEYAQIKRGTPSSKETTKSSSDLDFLKSKQINVDNLLQEGKDDKTRLFVRNIPYSTTDQELQDFFERHGPVTEARIIVDDNNTSKGYGFVRFSTAAAATTAVQSTEDFQGRILKLSWARPKPTSSSTGSGLEAKRVQQQEAATKAGLSTFVRSDAVVDDLASRLGIRNSEVLGVKDKLSSGDAAVRLAVAETEIINENRKFFAERGFDLDRLLGDSDNRSATSLIVKNLPHKTTLSELEAFLQVDASTKVILAPSHTIAVLQFSNASDAKYAFRKFSYRRFQSVPIYLDWAPVAAIQETPDEPEPTTDATEPVDDETTPTPTATLYVKNLNFVTTEANLQSHFAQFHARSARIPQKVGANVQLSMGYGFVEFQNHDVARRAMQSLQKSKLDGHALEISMSSQSGKTTVSKPKSCKLVVRNVPFQATRKDLLALFGSYGQLKRVRLPKKFDGTHRGFGFVEYSNAKDASAAKTALGRTHLYGRHLVIEYANEEESLDDLRRKAEKDIAPKGKKTKFTD